jgi:uncharacterized protein
VNVTGADARYWQALSQGHLELPRCHGCGRWHWPAVFRCGACGSWDQVWHEVPLAGTVFSWTRSWHPFAGTEGIGHPYVSVVVELQSAGCRLLGLLEGAEESLRIGSAVRGHIGETPIGDRHIPGLRWRLAERTR